MCFVQLSRHTQVSEKSSGDSTWPDLQKPSCFFFCTFVHSRSFSDSATDILSQTHYRPKEELHRQVQAGPCKFFGAPLVFKKQAESFILRHCRGLHINYQHCVGSHSFYMATVTVSIIYHRSSGVACIIYHIAQIHFNMILVFV